MKTRRIVAYILNMLSAVPLIIMCGFWCLIFLLSILVDGSDLLVSLLMGVGFAVVLGLVVFSGMHLSRSFNGRKNKFDLLSIILASINVPAFIGFEVFHYWLLTCYGYGRYVPVVPFVVLGIPCVALSVTVIVLSVISLGMSKAASKVA